MWARTIAIVDENRLLRAMARLQFSMHMFMLVYTCVRDLYTCAQRCLDLVGPLALTSCYHNRLNRNHVSGRGVKRERERERVID